jgi:hypothetical protein
MPISPADRPDNKRCPHCKRTYAQAVIKKDGKGKITFHCPYCGKQVG